MKNILLFIEDKFKNDTILKNSLLDNIDYHFVTEDFDLNTFISTYDFSNIEYVSFLYDNIESEVIEIASDEITIGELKNNIEMQKELLIDISSVINKYKNDLSDDEIDNLTYNYNHRISNKYKEKNLKIPFFNDNTINLYTYFNNNIINLLQIIKNASQYQNIIVDLISCNLNENDFIQETKLLEQDIGITIRYSLDQTGNNPQGNWTLESHNINIKYLYFNSNIENWDEILVTYDYGVTSQSLISGSQLRTEFGTNRWWIRTATNILSKIPYLLNYISPFYFYVCVAQQTFKLSYSCTSTGGGYTENSSGSRGSTTYNTGADNLTRVIQQGTAFSFYGGSGVNYNITIYLSKPPIASELFYGFSFNDVVSTYTTQEILDYAYIHDVKPFELYRNGFSISQLQTMGYSNNEILYAGYTPQQLLDASYSKDFISNKNFNKQDLLDAGFSISEINQYKTNILKNNSFEDGPQPIFGRLELDNNMIYYWDLEANPSTGANNFIYRMFDNTDGLYNYNVMTQSGSFISFVHYLFSNYDSKNSFYIQGKISQVVSNINVDASYELVLNFAKFRNYSTTPFTIKQIDLINNTETTLLDTVIDYNLKDANNRDIFEEISFNIVPTSSVLKFEFICPEPTNNVGMFVDNIRLNEYNKNLTVTDISKSLNTTNIIQNGSFEDSNLSNYYTITGTPLTIDSNNGPWNNPIAIDGSYVGMIRNGASISQDISFSNDCELAKLIFYASPRPNYLNPILNVNIQNLSTNFSCNIFEKKFFISDISLNNTGGNVLQKYELDIPVYGVQTNIIQNGTFENNTYTFNSNNSYYNRVPDNDTNIDSWTFEVLGGPLDNRTSIIATRDSTETLLQQNNIDFVSDYYMFLRNTSMKQQITNLNTNKTYKLSFKYQKRNTSSLDGDFKVIIDNTTILNKNMNDISINVINNTLITYNFDYFITPSTNNIELEFISTAKPDVNEATDAILLSDITLYETESQIPISSKSIKITFSENSGLSDKAIFLDNIQVYEYSDTVVPDTIDAKVENIIQQKTLPQPDEENKIIINETFTEEIKNNLPKPIEQLTTKEKIKVNKEIIKNIIKKDTSGTIKKISKAALVSDVISNTIKSEFIRIIDISINENENSVEPINTNIDLNNFKDGDAFYIITENENDTVTLQYRGVSSVIKQIDTSGELFTIDGVEREPGYNGIFTNFRYVLGSVVAEYIPPSTVDITLDALNQNIFMNALAVVDILEQQSITADAKAKLYVSTSQFRELFQFQTDASDIDTIQNNSDIQFKTDSSVLDNSSNLNPFASKVIEGFTGSNGYASNKLCVRHDFIRKVAKDVFGTEKAVDIFENETEMLDNLTTLGNNINTNLVSLIDNANGMLESQDTSDNLVKKLFDQILGVAPERFDSSNTDVSNVLQDTNEYQGIPFNDGDTIRYKLVVNPYDTNNGSIISGLPGPTVKTYEIIMELRDNVNNGSYDNEIPNDISSSFNSSEYYYSYT